MGNGPDPPLEEEKAIAIKKIVIIIKNKKILSVISVMLDGLVKKEVNKLVPMETTLLDVPLPLKIIYILRAKGHHSNFSNKQMLVIRVTRQAYRN